MRSRPHRVILFDVMRVIAVALVMTRHMQPYETGLPAWIQPAVLHIENFGWIGVDLFFVLSGFLISGLLFREYQRFGEIRVIRFLARRGFKIYPPFYLMIAAVIYIQASNYNYGLIPARQIWPELLFFQDYRVGLLDHTWSLGVEEQFYLLLPLVLLLMIRRGRGAENPFRSLPVFCAVVAISALVARFITAMYTPFSLYRTMTPFHLRLDSLLFGVLISYFYHFFPGQMIDVARRYRWLLAATGVALIFPVCIFDVKDWFVYTTGFSLVYLGFGLILLAGLGFQFPVTGIASIPLRVLAFIGAHSYSIYLWHMPMKIWGSMYALRWFGLKPTPTSDFLVYVGGTFGLGIALSVAVETPVLAVRDWLVPSRSKPLTEEGKGKAAEVAPHPATSAVATLS